MLTDFWGVPERSVRRRNKGRAVPEKILLNIQITVEMNDTICYNNGGYATVTVTERRTHITIMRVAAGVSMGYFHFLQRKA